MRKITVAALVGASALAFATPTFAQADNAVAVDDDAGIMDDVIIVQARRRDESIQDVPVVVQAVTPETLQKLNIREFEDIETLVPGLQMDASANGSATQTTLRGIEFDVNASGNNGTVEFYYNDAPIASAVLFQSLFDIGQIEVLRGPQGTLRGRASPSGSITVTSRRPDLYEAGGYVEGTLNDIGGWNFNSAINIPIIRERLAIRIAGIATEGDGNDVRSLNSPIEPYTENQGIRVSARAEPIDALSLFFTYGRSTADRVQFDQVESVSFADPTAPASPTFITASDRLAVMGQPRVLDQDFETFNWQAELRLLGQKLNYVGSKADYTLGNDSPYDAGGVFAPDFPQAAQAVSQTVLTQSESTSHEIRLSNEARVFGVFDYVLGYMNLKTDTQVDLTSRFPLFGGPPSPTNLVRIFSTPVARPSGSREESFFGNLTFHLSEATEISAGARHINYANFGALIINGSEVPAGRVTLDGSREKTWIYSASVKHRFSPNFMAYASFGSSWRPGGDTNPIILRDVVAPSPVLSSLFFPEDEESKSYEIGIKSDFWNNRLIFNLAAYYQDFENFSYFAPNIFYGGQNSSGTNSVFTATGIAVGVPAKVKGVEAEIFFRATDNWSIGAVLAYADSEINGTVPCNDYSPNDGVPDATPVIPSFEVLNAATDGAGVAFCDVTQRAGSNAPFTATVTTEYFLPVSTKADAYLRGLLAFKSNSQNDPTNAIDDYDAYGVVNLFTGIRDADGRWDVGAYAKNVFNTQRVLQRDANPLSTGYRSLPFFAASDLISTYRGISVTPPQEFGVTARFSFGSR